MKQATAALVAFLLILGSQMHASADGPDGTIAAADRDALDAALADLLSYKGDESPLKLMMADPSGRFAVAPDSAKWPLTVNAILERCNAKWQGLSKSEWRGLREAAADLVARVERKDGFTGFPSKHERFHASRGEESGPFDLYRPIHAWAPGYSRDKALVVVRLSIPWSIHSADATYLIRKTESGWTIVRREFAIYV
jgi:hypothetical protein